MSMEKFVCGISTRLALFDVVVVAVVPFWSAVVGVMVTSCPILF